MIKQRKQRLGSGKAPYTRPRLTPFGSVRNLTGGSGGGGDDGILGMTMMSDRTAKEDIVLVGTHPAGFGLYLFDYKAQFRDEFGHGRKFGVMADEVEKIVPEAVVVGANGYKAVDYAKLGIVLH